jgi:hypothetical protein
MRLNPIDKFEIMRVADKNSRDVRMILTFKGGQKIDEVLKFEEFQKLSQQLLNVVQSIVAERSRPQ